MQRYEITGMSCAACASHVEKAVAAVPGVASVAVSLLTNSMQVDYAPDADPDATARRILRAVDAAGYGASLASAESESAELEDTETPKLKKRLIASLCFLVPLMYVSMGHMIGLPLGSVFHGGGWHAILYAGTQLVLTLPVCWINRAFFISGWKGIKTRAPGMDTLVALGAGASLAYGVFAIVMICIGLSTGNDDLVMQYRHDLYFESAAMILTLITVGKTLEAYSKGKTTDALKSLMKLAPQTACVLRGGEQVTVPVSEVNVGDLFLVRPGESIPVDGTVTEGISTVNEAALTGESMPVDKFPGSPVSAATINQNGALTCRAERVGQDTTLSQVIRLVRDAAATKAPLAKTADRVSGIFVPTVICIAAATFVIWLLLGQTFTFALARGISVLVISCPCALGLATPVAIMVGSGVGAKNGILFKTAASLETTGYTDAVLLDKTGTVTTGEPNVVKIFGTRNVPEKFLLSMAAGLELRSEHPLARAILQRAEKDHLSYATVTDFEAVPGKGLRGKVAGKVIAGGNADFIRETCALPDDLQQAGDEMSADGITPLYFSLAGKAAGVIGVSDVVKESSAAAIAQMQTLGLQVVMLTGDNAATARHIGAAVGLDADHVIAGVLPAGKEAEAQALLDRLNSMNQDPSSMTPRGVEVKKPNIYLYPETKTEITVTFDRPELLTVSDPLYGDGWTVTAHPDGTLEDAGGKYGFLFYESLADPSIFRLDEGFVVKAEQREQTYRRVLEAYGFNEQEILDFIEYWTDYLEPGVDYVMYPLLTEGVDAEMPVRFSVQPDNIFRLWFGFVRYEGGAVPEPEIVPMDRSGFEAVEWGGAVLN